MSRRNQTAEERGEHDEREPGEAAARRDPVAIGVASGVGLAAARLTCALNAPPPGVEEQLFASLFYCSLMGALVGVLFYFVVAATRARTVLRLATYGVGAYIFLTWFAWPMLVQRPAAALAELGGAAVATARRSEVAAREEWLQALMEAGRYGAPGATPPMLDVQASDAGFAVRVRNAGDTELVVALARVTADSAASGGWRGCAYSGYAGGGAQEWVTLRAGESASFDLEPYCAELFLDELDAHYEYRVGNQTVPVAQGWWTTSALVAPAGRADERGTGNTRLPSAYDARAFYGNASRRD